MVRYFPKPELVWLLGAGCRLIVIAMRPEVVSKGIFFYAATYAGVGICMYFLAGC